MKKLKRTFDNALFLLRPALGKMTKSHAEIRQKVSFFVIDIHLKH